LQTIIQNLFWAFFYNVFLIPIAAFGLLIPMIAAGAMTFSSIFVVTNSLRLRSYKVETLPARKNIFRQLTELAPRLVVPAATLGLLIAVSVGWLRPAQMDEMSTGRNTNKYRAFLDPTTPMVMAGMPSELKIEVIDQFGKSYADFETLEFGKYVYYSYVAVASSDLTYLEAQPLLINPFIYSGGGAGGMNEMGSSGDTASQPTNSANAEQAAYESRLIRPTILFPADGEYILFVNFLPRGGEKVTLAVPIEVGSAKTENAELLPDSALTQQFGGLTINMKLDGELKVKEDHNVSFEIIDELGQAQSQNIGIMSGNRSNMYAIDEKLESFIMANIVDRDNLQFSINFPKPGKYKIWFEFFHENRIRQVSFVVDVK
jgi:hypothetical protein